MAGELPCENALGKPRVALAHRMREDVPVTGDASHDARWPAVGFDLDGTLFDHAGSATEAVTAFLSQLGRDPDPTLIAAWFALERRHFESWRAGRISFVDQRRLRLRDFFAVIGMPVPDDPAVLDATFARYLVAYRGSWRAFPDAAPFLRALREQGTRIGILTNGNHEQQHDKLAAIGLLPLIDVVCTSEGIGHTKPSARAFEVFSAQLGFPVDQIAFVGDDADHDVRAARAAGMCAGLVVRSGAPEVGLDAALHAADRRIHADGGRQDWSART